MTCESCFREWDGNAQCPCGMGYFIDTQGESNDTIYEEEYELEDDPPENNSVKSTEIKNTIKEVGEIIDEIKTDIQDGKYLLIMDLLQKITNQINSP